MSTLQSQKNLIHLASQLSGDLFFDDIHRKLYATDASVYREMPLAVAYPKDKRDIQILIQYAEKHKTPLIPRTAGTSLGGQVVGTGIVMDMSKYFTKVLEVNEQEKWAIVQPGVIRDDLNRYLKPYRLMFAPETSTSNRAMIGGMVGNNSSGTHSIVYGTTREHILEIEAFLSDGALVKFGQLSEKKFQQKLTDGGIEGDVYRHIYKLLSNEDIAKDIINEYPKSSIHRRNTGYALDELLHLKPFKSNGDDFNFSKLLCGSEGTLAISTEIKVNLVPIPPEHKVVLCAHFHSLDESLRAVVLAMEQKPSACELMDKIILDCTKENIEQRKNRFFVNGDPEAILCIEFWSDSPDEMNQKANQLIQQFKEKQLGYEYPLVHGNDINKVWNLRKAGLGLLANIPGDKKAVAVIEDTAVDVRELPEYIHDFTKMLDTFGQKSVYYAHAGAGELHLRPILDIKSKKDREDFRAIALESAKLVKKYGGSLSGEHGDGRVRGEFIPLMIGDDNYQRLRELKKIWDPYHIFNPGKITDTPPMDESFRYEEDQTTREFDTIMDFSKEGGILRAAEKCNGSGDCRKSPEAGGTMCPSYQATRDEKDTTRARANILRDYLTHSEKTNAFDHKEIKEVLDLCLSCKGCTSECPSNVDMPALKAEFLHQYYQANGIPLRAKMFGYISKLNSLAALAPGVSNFMMTSKMTSGIFKKAMGIAPARALPTLHPFTLNEWIEKNKNRLQNIPQPKGSLFFFVDEFTNYNDVIIGIKAIELLYQLGYLVNFLHHAESGRAAISKGLLPYAKECAITNVHIFAPWINEKTPLIGIEPSAIFTFRDEYIRLVNEDQRSTAKQLGKNCILIEEFIYNEVAAGRITQDAFTDEPKVIKFQGHCHQKALSSQDFSAWALQLPRNYMVEVIPSGCCGMAGSFGYEAEHYEVSMKIGELVLFPAVRKCSEDTIISTPGTSCRHQIKDGTSRSAYHPAEVLFDALK
ncbi:MAG: FAD-binding protein [Chitinophagales bacterium]|nr:FAD-binding protein [Chitinophagales bacterium]MCZ2394709.1 FAD-binding protein [Chitinophagales bacterium]